MILTPERRRLVSCCIVLVVAALTVAQGQPAASLSVEQLLRDRIAAAFPHDGVLGEELGQASGTSGFNWIVDPIDGTKAFISGVPLYGTMVGVEHEGRVAFRQWSVQPHRLAQPVEIFLGGARRQHQRRRVAGK